MEIYIGQILKQYAGCQLYEGGPTFEGCIENFLMHVPVNSEGYEIMRAHFHWLRFEREPVCLFMFCHMSDFVGNMQLLTANQKMITPSGT